MAAVKVEGRLENFVARVNTDKGLLPASRVRTLQMQGFVDTGAVMNMFPRNVVEYLGIPTGASVIAALADEHREEMPMAEGTHVEAAGRRATLPCPVGPPQSEALPGQVRLEVPDLVADGPGRRLLPNPASPISPSLSLK